MVRGGWIRAAGGSLFGVVGRLGVGMSRAAVPRDHDHAGVIAGMRTGEVVVMMMVVVVIVELRELDVLSPRRRR